MDYRPVLSPSGLNRRAVLRRSAALSAALGLGGLHRATAQDATPVSMADHPLVGTWVVDRNRDDPTDMPTTNVLTADGGLTDPSVGAAGVWAATGERTADFTLIAIFAELESYFIVRGTLEVDAAGDTATATASHTHVASDGTVLDQVAQGISNYIRLRIEPLDAVGQPLAGFPAWTPTPAATPAT